MLEIAKDRGHLERVTNVVDEFFQKTAKLHSIPYLKGQYWITVAEDSLKV